MTPEQALVARSQMVREQLAARGISDPKVLEAMARVPREAFVEPPYEAFAYDDRPLPIGHEQTISQPFIVALMSQLARLGPRDRVLEIGAGCGYASAVLGAIVAPVGEVWGIEIIPALAARAQQKLASLGAGNVHILCADGTLGLPARAPFDAIVVWAGAPRIPTPLALQLAEGGRMVIPVGERDDQRLIVLTRRGDEFHRSEDSPVRFVDLTGRYGWGGQREA